jgi:hypothetical protein
MECGKICVFVTGILLEMRFRVVLSQSSRISDTCREGRGCEVYGDGLAGVIGQFPWPGSGNTEPFSNVTLCLQQFSKNTTSQSDPATQ